MSLDQVIKKDWSSPGRGGGLGVKVVGSLGFPDMGAVCVSDLGSTLS